MPDMSHVAEKNFEQLLTLVNQARTRNRKLRREAVKAGDADARAKTIEIDQELIKHQHKVIDLQAEYEASDTQPSDAEKALKSLVAKTRKRVRRVRKIADALEALSDVAKFLTKFSGVL